MKKSLCILSICFATLACCSACIQHNNPENPADPKTEIKQALQAACLPAYCEEIIAEANGKVLRRKAAVTFIYVTHDLIELRGGEQENVDLPVMGIIVFDKFQEGVPDALYLDGGDGKEPVKVENIEMVTPTLGVSVIGAIFALRGVEPIAATVNVYGAPDNNYLVDLATIQNNQECIDVRMAKEVENNLENFENMAFMRIHYDMGHILLSSIERVNKIERDGPGDDKFSLELLVGEKMFWNRSIVR